MRVLHVVRDLDRDSGGPSRSVPALAQSLSVHGVSCFVTYEDRRREVTVTVLDTTVRYLPIVRAGGLYQPLRDYRHLSQLHREFRFELIHVHGLWNGFNHIAAKFARDHDLPMILSPRGMLEPWALNQKRLKKRLAMMLYQMRDIRHAAALHATCRAEATQIRNLGARGKVFVISNGTEIPPLPEARHGAPHCKTVLFLSRVHPKKGVDNLIEAWNQVRPPGWKCIIAGPGDAAFLAHLRNLIRGYELEEQILLHDAVEGDAKWRLYADADLFVLPTHSENFGLVVAEALASGLPVITTKEAPWQQLESHRCGWWIDDSIEDLVTSLRTAIGISAEERKAMGERGRLLMLEQYTWEAISLAMSRVYRSVASGEFQASR